MNKPIYIIVLLACILPAMAQEEAVNGKKHYPFLQLNFHTGSFWTRSEYLTEQFSHPYKAIEARFGYQLSGKKLWQQYHRYPKYGFGMHYSDLVKDKADTIVGNPFSLLVFTRGHGCGLVDLPWLRICPWA